MPNSGYKAWSTLEQYFIDDNSSTGITKINSVDDADYVAPVYDDTACPLPSGNFELMPSYTMRFASLTGISNLPAFSYPVDTNAYGSTSNIGPGTLNVILDSVYGQLPPSISLRLDLYINGALHGSSNITSYGMTNLLSYPATDSGTDIKLAINSY